MSSGASERMPHWRETVGAPFTITDSFVVARRLAAVAIHEWAQTFAGGLLRFARNDGAYL